MNSLRNRHCTPLKGDGALGEDQIRSHLQQLQGWSLVNGAIEKVFTFADFHRTMAFVNALAWVAHREDHHPDLAVGYSRCTVRYSTHSVAGISINDFICAARIDALQDDDA